MRIKNVFLFAMASLAIAGCSDKQESNIELIQDMMDQPSVKAQEYDDFFTDHAGSRVPAENTQPVGFKPYRHGKDMDGAKANKNPLAGDQTPDTLMVGQKLYETNCAVCHGFRLGGDGSVAAKWPSKVPALSTDKIRGWTDGQIYHVITVGQGLMGPYASHVPQEYRWQVVNYIRYLQQNGK